MASDGIAALPSSSGCALHIHGCHGVFEARKGSMIPGASVDEVDQGVVVEHAVCEGKLLKPRSRLRANLAVRQGQKRR